MAEDVVADFPLECTSIKFYDWGEATIASPHRPPVFWTKCKIRQTSGKDMLIAHKMVESVISMCPHTAFLMLKCRVRQPPLRAGTFQQKQKAFIWGEGCSQENRGCKKLSCACWTPLFTKQITPTWRWIKVGQEARTFGGGGESHLQWTKEVGNKVPSRQTHSI